MANRRRGAGVAIRSFLSRLRIAWRFLIGKADQTPFCPAELSVTTFSMLPIHLHSHLWASPGNQQFAHDMIRRELCDQAAAYILYREEQTPEGGYTYTGDLYIYSKGQEGKTPC